MENGSPQEEPLKEKSIKKMKDKKSKQATVLKQLNNQNLYPLQERIGIYVTAALAALGLILITYTGVMALVSNAENESDAPIDVDVEEVYEMLDDLDDLLDSDDESEVLDQNADQDQDTAGSHQYVEPDEDEEPEDSTDDDVTIGIINDNMVNLWREPGSPDAMLALQRGYEVTIIDLYYNAYWSHVEIETDAIDGISTLQGFVDRNFIDVEEE